MSFRRESNRVELPNWYRVEIGFDAIELVIRALTEDMARLKAVYWCDENAYLGLPADKMLPEFVVAKPLEPIEVEACIAMAFTKPTVTLTADKREQPAHTLPYEVPKRPQPQAVLFVIDAAGRIEYPSE